MGGIYLLLGTNLGSREKNLQLAKEHLTASQVIIKKESSVYETAAWGLEDQPKFLNQVLEVDFSYKPALLLTIVNRVEEIMGRVRNVKWAQRLIDIDILYFSDQIVALPQLKIPHPEIGNRRFTLAPLAEIAPELPHPESKKTQLEMLAECQDPLKVEKLDDQLL